MLLAIDIGNTSSVFAVFDGDDLQHHCRVPTCCDGRTLDGYADALRGEGLVLEAVTDVIVSSVVPAANREIADVCRDVIGREAVFVTHEYMPFVIDLEKPEQVGVDRLVNVAAIENEILPAVVIDFGTATTFDVVNEKGAFVGGAIAPGVYSMAGALSSKGEQLPEVDVARPEHAIGAVTVEAMQSGIFWGYCGLVEKILGQITSELGGKPKVIATGGLASLFVDHIEAIETIDEMLTLRGLLEIYKGL